jgi:hypothetical protein
MSQKSELKNASHPLAVREGQDTLLFLKVGLLFLSMRVSELSQVLARTPESTIRFRLPSGELTPAHAHVTEVARISKRFIDCGGTFREDAMCRLQTWVADDYDHRLNAGKLQKILEKARGILGEDDLEVDVEHDLGFVTQFPLEGVEQTGSELILSLKGRNTACLAPELCCPTPPETPLIGLGKKR